MNYHKYFIENLNDNMLSLKLTEETETLNDLQDDLEFMTSHTPNKKASIEDKKLLIKEQRKLIRTIENELNNRKAA